MYQQGKVQAKGIFTLSMDLELSWGTIDHPGDRAKNRAYYEQTRTAIRKLLALLQSYQISATWAVTGHLFLDACQSADGVKHPEIPRSNYPHYHADWFAADPCSNVHQAPLWYAPDVIDWIINLPVEQEVGCHSFSHILMGHPATRRETVRAELDYCSRLAAAKGVYLSSFVFPRNQRGFLDELVLAGYTAFRSVDHSWCRYIPTNRLRRIARLVDQGLAITPPVALPYLDNGLVAIPASMLYLDMAGLKRYVPLASRVNKANRGLKQAVRQNKIFHLWFHPFNLATSPVQLLSGLEQIFETVSMLREQGELEVKTMSRLAADYFGRRDGSDIQTG